MKYASIALVCVCFFMSCRPTENQSNGLIRNLNPTDEPIQGYPVYKNVEVIPLETSPSCFIQIIKQVEMTDSCIFVLDLDNLYAFTREGKFITQMGRKGEGPGEYIALNTFYVNNDKREVTIVDNYKNKLINYDFAGKHLSTISVPENSFRCCSYSLLTGDNQLLNYLMMSMYDNKPYSLFNLEKNELNGHYLSYQPITVDNYMYAISMHPMTRSGEDIDMILPLCDTIYSYSTASSSFYPKYVIELPQKMIPKDKIRKNTPSYSEDIYNLAQQDYFPGFVNIFETDDKALLGYKYQGALFGYFLFDKEKKAGNYYSLITDDVTETLPVGLILNTYKNFFIGSLNASSLMSYSNVKDKKIQAVIETLKEDDNPCLVLYEF